MLYLLYYSEFCDQDTFEGFLKIIGFLELGKLEYYTATTTVAPAVDDTNGSL